MVTKGEGDANMCTRIAILYIYPFKKWLKLGVGGVGHESNIFARGIVFFLRLHSRDFSPKANSINEPVHSQLHTKDHYDCNYIPSILLKVLIWE